MLSTSFKAFWIMDQLRRCAGISVRQLLSVLDMSESTYSRISRSVTSCTVSALLGDTDLKVQRVLRILYEGYANEMICEQVDKHEHRVIVEKLHTLAVEILPPYTISDSDIQRMLFTLDRTKPSHMLKKALRLAEGMLR